jgi:hypothetical protein
MSNKKNSSKNLSKNNSIRTLFILIYVYIRTYAAALTYKNTQEFNFFSKFNRLKIEKGKKNICSRKKILSKVYLKV